MFATPFIDETFDIFNCHNYTLSIRCAPDGFSFSVFDQIVNKFIVFAEYELNAASDYELKNNVSELIANEAILQKQYKTVKVSYLTTETTVVPRALYEEEEIVSLYELSFGVSKTNEVYATKTHLDMVQIASIPKILMDTFLFHYTNASFVAPTTPLINYCSKLKHNQNRIYIELNHQLMYLIAADKAQIQLVNAFFVKNEADMAYYTLNIAKQLKADSKTEIILSGKIQPELEIMLKKYFEKVKHARFDQNYAVSYTFFQEPEHYHIGTLELALCE